MGRVLGISLIKILCQVRTQGPTELQVNKITNNSSKDLLINIFCITKLLVIGKIQNDFRFLVFLKSCIKIEKQSKFASLLDKNE